MSDHAAQPRERVIAIETSANNPPTSGVGAACTEPHIVLSPKCPGGEPCRGFALTLFEPESDDPGEGGTDSAQPVADGFTITIWRLNQTLGVWARGEPYVGAAYADQLVSYDIGGGAALYFEITGVDVPGPLYVLIAELP